MKAENHLVLSQEFGFGGVRRSINLTDIHVTPA
jgi:hypothetical protein